MRERDKTTLERDVSSRETFVFNGKYCNVFLHFDGEEVGEQEKLRL